MPNIVSARKRLRQAPGRRRTNMAVRSRAATMQRAFVAAADGGRREQAETVLRAYCSALDRAVKRGAIKRNNASRRKSRAAARLKALPPVASPG